MLKAVNDGFVSLVQWDMYDAYYDKLMHYGLIGQAQGGWPLKPGYFLMKLLTHTCHPGWRAVQVDGNTETVTAASMKSADGQLTVWAVNHGSGPVPTTFNILGTKTKRFHLFYWNASGNGELSDRGVVRSKEAGLISVTLPFQSVIAITTLPASIGNEKQ
jgi:hypothetical protein